LIPSSSYQLLILVALVLPGIVFGSTLQRLRGPTPEDKDASTRVLRAIAVGAAFDIAYVLILGPYLVQLVTQSPSVAGDIMGFTTHPRQAALWTLLLAGIAPAAVAYMVHIRATWPDGPEMKFKSKLKRALRTTYRTPPTAWDYIARARGGCFVRVRLADGEFIGGWTNEETFVSGYPEPRDIFIGSQWAVDGKGVFLHKIQGTLGVYVPLSENTVVEWLAAPELSATQVDSTRRKEATGGSE
jgi:hypothetical protein